MQGLAQYESEICECGLHVSVADEDPDLEMTLRRCPVCADLAKNWRQINARDAEEIEALGKTPAPDALLPTDGRFIGLRPKVPRELARLLDEAKAARDAEAGSTPA